MKHRSQPCGPLAPDAAVEFDRRAFLPAVSGVAGLPALGAAAPPDRHPIGQASKPAGIPGPYPGRVVEIHHPRSVRGGAPDPELVRVMVGRGMAGLTGIDEPVEAWRSMFQPGDIVGIKVNPV